jgi:hypothetical protein
MMNDTFKACGAFIGFIAGSYVERHHIHYEVPVGAKDLPILGFVGFLIVFAWKEFFAPATIVLALGGHWGNFIARFMLGFFVVAVWPAVIKKTAC